MILEIAQPFDNRKNWKVAGNPVKFKGFPSFSLSPPGLDEHKGFYTDNLHAIYSNQQSLSFEPQQKDYRCEIAFNGKDNRLLTCYACSFTWLNSKETYLICSINRIDFMTIKNSVSTATFHFSKATKGRDECEEEIYFLNEKLSKKCFSDISFVDTEVEILISVKI